jgi:hypothetical protein
MRLNKLNELIHNSSKHQNCTKASVEVHFHEIIDKVSPILGPLTLLRTTQKIMILFPTHNSLLEELSSAKEIPNTKLTERKPPRARLSLFLNLRE